MYNEFASTPGYQTAHVHGPVPMIEDHSRNPGLLLSIMETCSNNVGRPDTSEWSVQAPPEDR